MMESSLYQKDIIVRNITYPVYISYSVGNDGFLFEKIGYSINIDKHKYYYSRKFWGR